MTALKNCASGSTPGWKLIIYWIPVVIAVCGAVSAQTDLRAFLCKGDDVPGLTGVPITTVEIESIGAAGHIVGFLKFNGTEEMVYLTDPTGTTQKVINEGEVDSALGAPITSLDRALVSSAGEVALDVRLELGNPSSSKRAVLTGTQGSMGAVAYAGQAVPALGAGATITDLSPVQMNSAGNVALLVQAGATNAIWLDGAFVLKRDETYPGLDPDIVFKDFAGMEFNDDGDLLVTGRVERITGGLSRSGVWLYSGGMFTLLAESVTGPVPGFPDPGFLSSYTLRGLASGKHTAFSARVSNTGVTFATSRVYYVGQDQNLSLVARQGDPLPGVPGSIFPDEAVVRRFDVAANGNAMLWIRIPVGPGVTNDNDWGVWTWDGASLELLMREGDPAPGMPGETIKSISPHMAPDGRTIISASLVGVSGSHIFAEGALVVGPGATMQMPDLTTKTIRSANTGLGNSAYGEAREHRVGANGDLVVFADTDFPGSVTCAAIVEIGTIGGGDSGTITGEVRLDGDGDGDFADPDAPFNNVTLSLFEDDGTGTVTPVVGPALAVTTPVDGFYSFDELLAGSYVVVAELDSAEALTHVITAPTGGKRLGVVTAGGTDSGKDFLVALDSFPVRSAMLALTGVGLDYGEIGSSLPIQPTDNPINLSVQPELFQGEGLVADGMTPLVIKLNVEQAPTARDLRWECSVTGGGLARGTYANMQTLVAGDWVEASVAGPNLVTSEAAAAYVSIKALEPNDLSFLPGSTEVTLEFRVYGAVSGEQLALPMPIKLRRPPVFLIANSPSEGWGGEFLAAVHQSRAPDFVRPLSFEPGFTLQDNEVGSYYLLEDVLDELGWAGEIADLRGSWVFTYPDVIAHGNGGTLATGLALNGAGELAYLNLGNHFRGRFRNAVTIGSPHLGGVGMVQAFAYSLDQRIYTRTLEEDRRLAHIPETVKKIPAWNTDPVAAVGRSRVRVSENFAGERSGLARYHLMATRIDGTASQIYKQLGLTPSVLGDLVPDGADGVVDVDSALLGASFHPTKTLVESLESPFFAFGQDAALFGNAPRQTHSEIVGTEAVKVLDFEGGTSFLEGSEFDSLLRNQDYFLHQKLVVLEQLVETAVTPNLATLVEILSGRTRDTHQSYTIEIQEPVGEALTAGPYWFAEVFGPGGVITDGVTLTIDGANPLRVIVDVESAVAGDVVLYASYESSGATVIATPIRVASNELAGKAQSITLEPDGIVLNLGEAIGPVVWMNYPDGTSMRRWLTPAEFSVSSSAPGVVDVSEEMRWRAVAEGEATITLNFDGLSGQSVLTVIDPYPAVDYETWKADHFSAAELADPAISGDGADADGDGLGTLVEFVTGGDPRSPDAGNAARIANVDLGDGLQTVFIARVSSQMVGYGIAVQRSTDLTNWVDVAEEEPALIADLDLGSHRELWFDLATFESDRVFWRLSIGAPAATVTGATVLTFDGVTTALNPLEYGDRVDAVTSGGFSYGGEPGFTPAIETRFGPAVPWANDYADLTNVIYSNSGSLQLDFVAELGHSVRLVSFDLGGYLIDRPVALIEVLGADGTSLWSQADATAPHPLHAHFDLAGLGVESGELTLRISGGNVGLDNVRIEQVQNVDLGDWSVLTFENTGAINSLIDQSYGDRVSGVASGGHAYFGGGGFTPGIVAAYSPVGSARHRYGFPALEYQLVNSSGATTPLEVTLTADPGQRVRLFGFDMARWASASGLVDSVQVLDGSGAELFGITDFDVSTLRSRFDFTSAPLEADEIVIRIDTSSFGNTNARNVAISNVTFGQVPAN